MRLLALPAELYPRSFVRLVQRKRYITRTSPDCQDEITNFISIFFKPRGERIGAPLCFKARGQQPCCAPGILQRSPCSVRLRRDSCMAAISRVNSRRKRGRRAVPACSASSPKAGGMRQVPV